MNDNQSIQVHSDETVPLMNKTIFFNLNCMPKNFVFFSLLFFIIFNRCTSKQVFVFSIHSKYDDDDEFWLKPFKIYIHAPTHTDTQYLILFDFYNGKKFFFLPSPLLFHHNFMQELNLFKRIVNDSNSYCFPIIHLIFFVEFLPFLNPLG